MNLEFINSILFHPRKSINKMDEKDILIKVEENIYISSRIHLANFSYPTILFFHGNGEIASEYDEIAQVFNKNNINFIISDYRGYGFSNGTPNVKNIKSDAHCILDYYLKYLKNENYNGNLILMGRSLGSVSVLELAKRYSNDFNGIIIESGFADEKPLLKLIRIDPKQVGYTKEDGFLNKNKIKNYSGPLLIIHAEEDHIIPLKQGKILYNTCHSNNKKFISIANANHNNIIMINYKQYFEEISKFIKTIEN